MHAEKRTVTLIMPYISILAAMTGSWHSVFLAAAALNILAIPDGDLRPQADGQGYTKAQAASGAEMKTATAH